MRACPLTEQDALCLALSKNGLKYPEQGLGQLLLQVILGVDGNVVLQHVDRVLRMVMEELTSVGAHKVIETGNTTGSIACIEGTLQLFKRPSILTY